LVLAVTVERIVDGDTFVLKNGAKIRLIGVDCPESQDPNKPVEYYSDESKTFLDSLIAKKYVRLEYGEERTDKYGRLLCYVWVNDTVLVNLEIIKYGYGMAYLRFPHAREKEFLEAEIQARRQAIGMWASPRHVSLLDIYKAKQGETIEKQVPATQEQDETVYITKTGAKYHRASCNYLRKSAIPISKKDAVARGYGPCSKCRP
jgi:micrococcal nuclease